MRTCYTFGIIAALLVMAGGARAASVNCNAGQTIGGALAALKPSTNYVQINVYGACLDNAYVAPNQAIVLLGAKGASLAPANTALAAIEADGKLQIENFQLSTGSFTAVFANRGGFATVIGGTITGPGNGIQVSDNSAALVQNVTINVTGFAGINTYIGGNVEIDGVSSIFGSTSTTITGGTAGVNCSQGNLALNATGGPITFTNSGQYGIDLASCGMQVNKAPGEIIAINAKKAAGGFGAGISVNGPSYAYLGNIQIENNAFDGVFASQGASVQFSGVTLTGSGHYPVETAQNGLVHIVPYQGVNTITAPAGNTNPLFGCYQGGKVYVDQIAGSITPAPTPTNQGCLTIGGP